MFRFYILFICISTSLVRKFNVFIDVTNARSRDSFDRVAWKRLGHVNRTRSKLFGRAKNQIECPREIVGRPASDKKPSRGRKYIGIICTACRALRHFDFRDHEIRHLPTVRRSLNG